MLEIVKILAIYLPGAAAIISAVSTAFAFLQYKEARKKSLMQRELLSTKKGRVAAGPDREVTQADFDVANGAER